MPVIGISIWLLLIPVCRDLASDWQLEVQLFRRTAPFGWGSPTGVLITDRYNVPANHEVVASLQISLMMNRTSNARARFGNQSFTANGKLMNITPNGVHFQIGGHYRVWRRFELPIWGVVEMPESDQNWFSTLLLKPGECLTIRGFEGFATFSAYTARVMRVPSP